MFSELVYGMAAAQPATPNTRERLLYVFRGYCSQEHHHLDFPNFVRMVGHIQRHLGGDTAMGAVR